MSDLNNGAELLIRANKARDSGDAKQARKLYKQCTAFAPDLAIAWITYARFLYDQDNFGSAIRAANQALRGKRHKAWLHFFIGDCYKLSGKYHAAEKSLRRSLTIDPYQNNAWILLQDIFYIQDRNDEAIECLLKILEFDTDDKEAHFLLGDHYIRLKQYDLAERYLRRAIEVDPEYGMAYGRLGHVLLRKNLVARIRKVGAYAEAQRLLKKSIRLSTPMDSVWARNDLGVLLACRGHFEKAEEQFQKTLEIWPTCGAGLWLYADLLSSTGKDYVRAEELIRTAIDLDPEDGTPYFYLGKHWMNLNRDRDAKVALQQSLHLGIENAQKLLDELENR